MRELEAKPNLRDPIADDRLEDVARLREEALEDAREAQRFFQVDESLEGDRADALRKASWLGSGPWPETAGRARPEA